MRAMMMAGLVVWGAAASADAPAGVFPVRAFGAVGDAKTDDTPAFEKACAAAAPVGGTVVVEPVGPGLGYVITRTVTLPPGVSLVGSPHGMPFFLWEGVPRDQQRGCILLARPREEDWRGATKQPLFELRGGNTVRGLYILYDEQPWPSDEEFDRPASPYHYDTFEALRERFVREHARPYGPTFFGRHTASVTIEDVTCHGYWDFSLFMTAGKVFIERIYLYGYKRAFAIQHGPDTVRIRGIHLVPNVSTAISWKHAKLQAAIAWQEDNVAFDFNAVDGYSISDVVAFVVHTAMRLGSSKELPFVNTVTGERVAAEWGRGPWGSVENLKLDNVCVGIHAVTGTILPNQFHNVMVHVSLPGAGQVATPAGTVARQAAFLVSPDFAGATLQVDNLALSSFAPTRVAQGAQMVHQANGRAFLLDCPGMDEKKDFADRRQAHLDIRGLVVSNIPQSHLVGLGTGNRGEIHATSFIHNGIRTPDLAVDPLAPAQGRAE